MRDLHYRKSHRAGGFTLLEMIIGLAILSIVMGLSVGWVVNHDGQEVESAYADVDATLRTARAGAMETHIPWLISIAATGIQAQPQRAVDGDSRFKARSVSWSDGTILEVYDEQSGNFFLPEDPVQVLVTHRAFLPAMQLRIRNEARWVSGVIDPVSGVLTVTGAEN